MSKNKLQQLLGPRYLLTIAAMIAALVALYAGSVMAAQAKNPSNIWWQVACIVAAIGVVATIFVRRAYVRTAAILAALMIGIASCKMNLVNAEHLDLMRNSDLVIERSPKA